MEGKPIPIVWLKGQHSYTAIIPKEKLKAFGMEEINDVIVEVGASGILIKNNSKQKRDE